MKKRSVAVTVLDLESGNEYTLELQVGQNRVGQRAEKGNGKDRDAQRQGHGLLLRHQERNPHR